MKERVFRILRFLAYPAFYCFCLVVFGFATFPYARLKDRLVAEFQKRSRPGTRFEVEHVSSYWFTGIEMSGLKLVMPKDDGPPKLPALPDAKDAKPKETVITIEEAHARLRVLPLLIGRLKLSFWISALGGEIKGTMPIAGSKGDIDVEVENVEIGRVDPLVAALGGVPIHGTATGKVELSPDNGKLSKGTGSVDLTIANVVVSDGKTKIQGLIELPAAKLGDLVIAGEAKDGVLTLSKLGATGADMEIVGAGKVGLHDNWQNSIADIFVRFKFTDAYRGKNELTKGLLGVPGGTGAGLIEMQVPKMKRAKRPDGFYGFHAHGPLKKLTFDSTLADGPGAASGAPTGAPGIAGKRPGANPFVNRPKVPPQSPLNPPGAPRPPVVAAPGAVAPPPPAPEPVAAPEAPPPAPPPAAEPEPAPEPAAPAAPEPAEAPGE